MHVPRVTVVVPMHNSERHISQTLASISSQSYRDWHAVLIDDASSDRTAEITGEICRRDPDRFDLLRLDRNVGVAAARNAGIEASPQGELIALLDHDDYWLDGYLERMVEAFDAGVAAGRNVGIVASDALIANETGPTGALYSERTGPISQIDYDAMIACNMICARALFTRGAYLEVGGFSSQCPGCDDYDLWLRIIEAGYAVEVVPEAIVAYREHSGAQSANRELMSRGAIAAFSRALERDNLTPRQRRALRAQIRHYRALRERALVRSCLQQGAYVRGGGHALRAAPYGVVAFLQAPRRWGEWAGLRRERDRSTPS